MPLNAVKGFYTLSGSVDLPSSFDWTKPFGFNEGAGGAITGPVFNYSLLDVIKNFIKPNVLLRDNPYVNTTNSILIAESYENEEIQSQEIYQDSWTKLYKILQSIYINQSTWNLPPTNADSYRNKGDEELSLDAQLEDSYIPNSLEIYTDSNAGNRFYKVYFRSRIDGAVVDFEIFFSPDYYIRYGAPKVFDVYTYEDIDGNNIISEQEMDQMVVDKFFQTTKNGQFKRWDKFKTRKRIGDYAASGGSTEGTTFEEQIFYVFSSLAPEPVNGVTTADKSRAARKYLTDKYPGASNMSRLIWTYPDLFTTAEVTIVPVYNNYLSGTGNNNTVKHPFDAYKLIETLNRNNYDVNPNASNGTPYEIFYIGYLSNNNYSYLYPLIAFENKQISEVRYPISSRFPDYKPIFSQDTAEADENSEKFHQFIILSLNIISGLISLADIPQELSYLEWTHTTAEGNVPSEVTFTYANVKWKIKGQL